MRTVSLSAYILDIIKAVQKSGDAAIVKFTAKYDHTRLMPSEFKVGRDELADLSKKVPGELKEALDISAANIARFHAAEVKNLRRAWGVKSSGISAGQVIGPVDRVGIYVPGGRFSYPSTVLMTAIPADKAGVEKISIVTPPSNITPAFAYASLISGADTVYRIGGPWAVAALAYGTQNIDRVDMIVGPGNKYVNEAKRQVYGKVGIDSLAGPSEIAIIADDSANDHFIARDIMAQLEHDPDARAYLFTDSLKVFRGVNKLLYDKAGRRQFKVLKCTLGRAVEHVNELAPEHLEINTKNAKGIAARIRNAGAIFLGKYTPVASGDYWIGPSHTLPTGGAARFSSGLSSLTFMKRTSVMELERGSFNRDAKLMGIIAGAEGLIEHKRSLEIREK